ncbi:FAD-dependent monooxygenase [Fimbriiglobus ruber]|uniref:Salicylate hydroxylase n=1 Tax=Fimbriiglobus ruber TaxID=1908690 RepID=A0A225DCS2_9BACT|nr:FAD-dependent monooxygenase [Fimbriiglobus ruber]OWK39341.1 Salicylate hydroxylase [Fimbriiglobus ruber]
MDKPQVLIAGAGPTGLVLALWLARVGVPFRLIDRKPGPGEGSRAIAVQARTLEFYRQLGIAADVIARGFKIDRFRLRNQSGVLATSPLGEVGKGESPYPFVLTFPQDDHERLLIDRLRAAGHAVEWDTELTTLTQHDDGVRAVLRSPGGEETWTGSYLCGCDGAHSAVRHGLGVGFPGGTYDQPFYVADVMAEGDWSEHDISAYFAEKTLNLVFPVREPGMFRLIGLVPEDLRGRDDLRFDDLREGVERTTGTRVTKVNWFSKYRVHHRVADHFRHGRVFLAGDAGHVHSPAGGQGMNTGIGDAVNLAWKLAAVLKGQANPSLLDSYDSERLPFARALVATTDRVFAAIVGGSFLTRMIRSVGFPYLLPLVLRFEAARRAQFRLVSQTRITYRKGPLADGVVGTVHAGDRLPWVEGTDNYEPLKSLDWQIHVYGTPTAALRDFTTGSGVMLCAWPWTEAARQAGLRKNALYLVRPDGHIGFARGTQDVEKLRKYLAARLSGGMPRVVEVAAGS